MTNLRNRYFPIFIVFSLAALAITGCAYQKINVQELLNRPIEETARFHQSKKYIKHGVTVVYLTGPPYEVGFAHGKLCKDEIWSKNKYYLDLYDKLKNDQDNKWLTLSKGLERYIPQEQVLEMQGIADGSGVGYDKILWLNTLTTISETSNCFAFSFQKNGSSLFTVRQADLSKKIQLWKRMILYIIKPQKGYGFAALLNPGWVSGETGMNEKGITVSENNIKIKQTEWDIMSIDQLSRNALQYSESIDDFEILLRKQNSYAARLLFVSSKTSAAIFEIANKEIARIDMKDGFLAMANHAIEIPSRNITASSMKRLKFANMFLRDNLKTMDIEKAIDLVRASKITWRWNPSVNNRQSIIFSPSTLDFWIAIPPESDYVPASYGPYIGFNLRQELYCTGHEPEPKSFPAY